MLSHDFLSTPLAARIRKVARAAKKRAIIDGQFAEELIRASSELALFESCFHAPASWKAAAIAVALIEAVSATNFFDGQIGLGAGLAWAIGPPQPREILCVWTRAKAL